MAGEPLLYGSATALVVVDEPSCDLGGREHCQAVSDMGVAIAGAGALPLLDLRADREAGKAFVADQSLIDRIKALNKRALIVCGGLLEGALTQVSLRTLMDGYDVFVPADLICTAEPENEHLFLSRITSCGGNVLTSRQVILELLSGIKESEKRGPLEALLNAELGRLRGARKGEAGAED